MRFFLTAVLFSTCPLFSETILTLVDEPGSNSIAVRLSVTIAGTSNDTAKLSGTLVTNLDFDPLTEQTSELTILSADIKSSDLRLRAGNILARYDIQIKDLAFNALTPEPPGIVNPATGIFNNDQHEFTVYQGTASGTGNSLATGAFNLDFDFAEQNFTSPGTGTGSVTTLFNRLEDRNLIFDVTALVPLDLDQDFESDDLPVDVNVRINGTVKAIGQTTINLPDYATWATSHNLPADSELDRNLLSEFPNYYPFVLGFSPETTPPSLITFSSTHAIIQSETLFALGDFSLEGSHDLITWTPIPNSTFSLGSPLGEALSFPLTDLPRFLRLNSPSLNLP